MIWRAIISHFMDQNLILKNQKACLWRKKNSWEIMETFSKNQIQPFYFPLDVVVTGQMLVASFIIMESFILFTIKMTSLYSLRLIVSEL